MSSSSCEGEIGRGLGFADNEIATGSVRIAHTTLAMNFVKIELETGSVRSEIKGLLPTSSASFCSSHPHSGIEVRRISPDRQ